LDTQENAGVGRDVREIDGQRRAGGLCRERHQPHGE
jgi:hypothetical protein